ncbi:unnamed protein product [Somion occarium]|uniref:Fungal-type protein kinase domain-containing protein n=1 Tax=Somion occarium TaxID=3059160 RepID=A0ABP1CK72_9APHY
MDQVQYTKSHEYSRPSDYPAWRLPCEAMPKLVHHRLVQELVYPLASVVSSKENLQAIRDAVETIKVARKVGRSLHRDISTGNIMIGKNGRGILNDWDQAIKLLSSNAHTYRTGTWAFISVHLLRNPRKPHDVYDDLESAFWVLLSISLEYFPHHQLRGRPLSHDIFHEIRDVNDQIYSGCHKGLGRIFRTYVCLDLADEGQMVGDVDGGVDNIIDLFDSALSSDGWVEDDVVQEIDPKRQQLEARAIIKTVRRPSTVEYGNNSTDTKTALSTNYPRSQSLGKDVIQQRNPAPEAGHSQALASSRSSQKRTADDMPPEPLIRSKRRKMSTTRRPKARPPALPVVQHRYPTRSKLNASDHRNNFVVERNTELARIRQTNKPTYGDSKLSQPKFQGPGAFSFVLDR